MVWKSIPDAQVLIQSGCRWKVRDGRSINAWGEPWIVGTDTLCLETIQEPELMGLKVCDLFILGLKEWDEELIEGLFNPRDAEAICSILLSLTTEDDIRVWNYTKDGQYSVKSGNRLIMEKLVDMSQLHVEGQWTKLWALSLPPRIKILICKMATLILPTRNRLLERGMQVLDECGVCNSLMETPWHLFVDCAYAKECWERAGL
ncbi:Putative ribonuclease H protein At1g65750 [Linum perenne]